MKKWMLLLLVLTALSACKRDERSDATAEPPPAATPPPAVSAPVPAAVPAPLPAAAPAPAALAPALPLAPTGTIGGPAQNPGQGKGEGGGDRTSLAPGVAPAGFGEPCPANGKCPRKMVCHKYGDDSTRCTLKCAADLDCPGGADGNGCGSRGVCRPPAPSAPAK